MQHPSTNQPAGYGELQAVLAPMVRQMERLEDRTRDDVEAVRKDIEALRKDLISIGLLVPQLTALKDRIDALEKEQVTRFERFWMRFGPLVTLGMGILALIEYLTHGHVGP